MILGYACALKNNKSYDKVMKLVLGTYLHRIFVVIILAKFHCNK